MEKDTIAKKIYKVYTKFGSVSQQKGPSRAGHSQVDCRVLGEAAQHPPTATSHRLDRSDQPGVTT